MMMSCRQMVDKLNEGKELSLYERMKIGLHVLICPPCWCYVKNINSMQSCYQKLFTDLTEVEPKKAKNLEDQVIKSVVE